MRSASVHRGFTLVEVVVVIGIIILMVALTISVGVVVVEGSEVRQTETVLRQLDTALQEWQTHADRRLTWGDSSTGAVYDMQRETGTESPVFLVTELLNTIARSSNIQNIVAGIDPDFVHTYRREKYPEWIAPGDEAAMDDIWAVDNIGPTSSLGLAILDAWGLPFRIAHPGCVDGSVGCVITTLTVDVDGTVRTGIENEYGIAKNRQILFVSAGPDGEFGDLHLDTPFDELSDEAMEDVREASDNTYSYAPSVERP
ncbi:MAG: hypothetical protein IH983_10945 [Planctomycetes bacterium]|nr:hypothetical protein [Planctomycetota bacterium]